MDAYLAVVAKVNQLAEVVAVAVEVAQRGQRHHAALGLVAGRNTAYGQVAVEVPERMGAAHQPARGGGFVTGQGVVDAFPPGPGQVVAADAFATGEIGAQRAATGIDDQAGGAVGLGQRERRQDVRGVVAE
jgi:hypothetical protein